VQFKRRCEDVKKLCAALGVPCVQVQDCFLLRWSCLPFVFEGFLRSCTSQALHSSTSFLILFFSHALIVSFIITIVFVIIIAFHYDYRHRARLKRCAPPSLPTG
jgi:hypothetical protein